MTKYYFSIFILTAAMVSAGLCWMLRENAQLRAELGRQVAVAAANTQALKKQVAEQTKNANTVEANLGHMLDVARGRAASLPDAAP